MNSSVKFCVGTHEECKLIEPLDMNYVTCGSTQEAMDFVYKFEEIDKDKEVDHVRITKGIYGEDVYYVYYRYTKKES